jgi:uncharacterized protein YkwD
MQHQLLMFRKLLQVWTFFLLFVLLGACSVSINLGETPTATPVPQASTPVIPAASLEQQLLQLINQDRAANKLAALNSDAALQKVAAQHNLVMAGGCGLNHECAGEPLLDVRVNGAGVKWSALGENVGVGGPVQSSYESRWNLTQQLHKSMMDEKPPEDGHRKNLLSKDYARVGISIYVDSKNELWLTEDFAS